MSPTETISWIGHDLATGESVMAPCPFCGTAEKKLAVTRYSDGLGYRCFRASCNASGAITEPGIERAPLPSRRPESFEPRPIPYELGQLEGYGIERLGYCNSPFPWASYSAGPDTIVFMLDDFQFRTRGWTSRTRDKRINSGKLMPGPLYGYYNDTAGVPPTLWVVEDCISAIRLAQEGEAALALLGTHLHDPVVDELWDAYPECKRIYVALDPGAEDAARKIVTRLRFHHGLDAIQVPLPDDIHRLDSETFQTILEAYK